MLPAAGMQWIDVERQIMNVNTDGFAGDSLTVVTYNMLHGFGDRTNDATLEERLALLTGGIAQALPDIVILQEVSLAPGGHGNLAERLRDELNARLGGRGITYNSVFAMANGSRLIGFFEGSAILSRFTIESAECLVYGAQARIPPERRIALRARIAVAPWRKCACGAGADAPQATVLDVIGTHLTHTEARRGGRLVRTAQAEQLVGWLRQTPSGGSAVQPRARVIGGDFNDAPDSDTIRMIVESAARDAWAEARPQHALGGFTVLSGSVLDAASITDARIDYLFAEGDSVSVQTAKLFLDKPFPQAGGGFLWASDHIGVEARIRVRSSERSEAALRPRACLCATGRPRRSPARRSTKRPDGGLFTIG
jgi:endonuclease/exonuclease/phosphatase family metal-dependent hydrolase